MKTKEINYYISQKPKLLKFFDRLMKNGKKVLVSRYGDDFANMLAAETRQEYESLIPQIPYIGGVEPWTRQLILTTLFLAIYRAMKSHGKTADEAWKLCSDMEEVFLHSIPRFVRNLMRNSAFTRKQLNQYRKQAAESPKRQYPGGDVCTIIEGEGEEFDYGIDITECAKCKFYRDQDAEEFLPYICLVDKLWAEALDYGLVRTRTLADGFDRCDFRLKKDGITRVDSPVWKKEWERSS